MSKAENRMHRTTDSRTTFLIFVIFLSLSFFGIGLLNASDGWAKEVTLEWDPNTEPNIGGYIVHYGTQSGIYEYSLDVGNFTSAVISGLDPDTEYFFAVSAYNLDGLSSALSNEVTTALVPSSTFRTAGGGGGGGCFITSAQKLSDVNNKNFVIRNFQTIWRGIEKAAHSLIN